MRVCYRYGFTFLSMPKCASTSIEKALEPYSQLSTNSHTGLKHINYRNYRKYIQPFIKQVPGKELEVVCLMRDPISWLHSWYRYRSRDKLVGSENSTRGIGFNEYCEAYLSPEPPNYVNRGKQSRFLKGQDGKLGDIKIFKYENMDDFKRYIEGKIGKSIELQTLNVSPEIDFDLDPEIEGRLREYLKYDYEIYNLNSRTIIPMN